MRGAIDARSLLRPGLLETSSVLVASPPAPADAFGGAVREGCAALGARVGHCEPEAVEEAALDRAVAEALADLGALDLLVVDGAGLFARALAAEGHAALRACVDCAWNVTRAVVNLAFLPAGAGGRIVYLAPPPDAGECAEPARAGLENLARTLSVEWARHGIATATIAPGSSTAAGEVAALCAYLASPAGAYFSGCLLDLRGP